MYNCTFKTVAFYDLWKNVYSEFGINYRDFIVKTYKTLWFMIKDNF